MAAGEPGVFAVEHPGQAEVGDLGDPAVEEDVAGFQVAMDDPLAVCRVDRRGDAAEQVDDLGGGQRAAVGDALGERTALAELHREVRLALFGAAEVEDRDDVRVHQGAGGTGLAAKAREGDRRGKELREQDLDRDRPVHLLVQRPIDDAGTPLTDALEDPVAAVEKASQSRLARTQDDSPLRVPPSLKMSRERNTRPRSEAPRKGRMKRAGTL